MHIYPSRRNFFVLTKISYLQPFREIMGGQNSVTTNNEKQRTTNTTDDHNSPPGFFQNSRTNNHYKYDFISFQSSLNKKSILQETRALKNDATGQKNDFFLIFFSVAHLPIETKLFCFYQNFISSAVQRNYGGTKQRYNKQTTNKQTKFKKFKIQNSTIYLIPVLQWYGKPDQVASSS